MSMFESSPTTPLVLRAEVPLIDEAQLAPWRSWLATPAGRSSPTALISASTSNGLSKSA